MMTDAPERIWGGVENLDAYMPTVWYRKEPCHGDDLLYGPFTEYLRADLCDRDAILEEAAKEIETLDWDLSGQSGVGWTVWQCAAAIRAMKEAK